MILFQIDLKIKVQQAQGMEVGIPISANDVDPSSVKPILPKQEILVLPTDKAELLREANTAKIPPAVLNNSKHTDTDNEEILRYVQYGIEKGFEQVAKEIGVDPELLKGFINDPIINEGLPEEQRIVGCCGAYISGLDTFIIDFKSLQSVSSDFHENFKDLPADVALQINSFGGVEHVLGILDKQKRALAAISLGAHEALHQARDIARKMLSPKDRSNTNRRKIVAEVRSGRFGTILAQPFHNSISTNFIEPPVICSSKLRNALASFLDETLEAPSSWV